MVCITEETQILALLIQRDENALREMTLRYGDTCHAIAASILGNQQDAEEVWNDALMKIWETIPPPQPASLFAYLAVMVRNLAYDHIRSRHRKKRFGHLARLALEELAECIPSDLNIEQQLEAKQFGIAIASFLETLPKETRTLFLQRYWVMLPVRDISKRYGIKENTVKSTLRRTRERLRCYLEKEGYL